MREKRDFSQQEVRKKIHNLRFKLNESYKNQGHTSEVIRISQELDKYIVLMQQRLVDDKNLAF